MYVKTTDVVSRVGRHEADVPLRNGSTCPDFRASRLGNARLHRSPVLDWEVVFMITWCMAVEDADRYYIHADTRRRPTHLPTLGRARWFRLESSLRGKSFCARGSQQAITTRPELFPFSTDMMFAT